MDTEFPNIVLLTLDAFNFNLALENINLLPFFKKVVNESVVFKNAFSVGPNTFFAFPAIIGGVYPYHFGVGLPPQVPTMYSLLKRFGYNTALINESNALLTPYYGYGRGLDYQEHFLKLSPEKNDRNRTDVFLLKQKKKGNTLQKQDITFKRSKLRKYNLVYKLSKNLYSMYRFFNLRFFDTTQRYTERRKLHQAFKAQIEEFITSKFKPPQFLWIHTIVNHLPYLPPNTDVFSEKEVDQLNYIGLSNFNLKRHISQLRELYIESLKTTDILISDVFKFLEKAGRTDDTIVIITADHGEEFMENSPYFGHDPESSSDNLLHVPLIFYNLEKLTEEIVPKNVECPVSTIDLMPTLLDLLGIKNKVWFSGRGLSLKPLITNTNIPEKYTHRNLYSEAWELHGLLDRSPGFSHSRTIFTVRNDRYKLKVILEKDRNGAYVEKEANLYDWHRTKELSLEKYYEQYFNLYSALFSHLYTESQTARMLRHHYEIQKIKDQTRKIRLRRMG
ncbi:sulfatase-like hydrolase/transferase [Palaeococcus ferrophilus]|uniref:sulfatase-like hydrolase/transferase n=1 Tax=Palaeococcus ferrophilus TaxID=83868 RepID=UPI00064E9F53|nr:sulfatase-like hydrolase/transferase [Palaeococcus ferrophilus]